MTAPQTPTGAVSSGRLTSNSTLLTAEELAERWRLPRSWVYAKTRADVIPSVRLGRYYRYRLDAIEAFERDGGNGNGS